MVLEPADFDRRSVRLRGFDYGSVGSYFVTVCAFERRLVFGSIDEGALRASAIGAIVLEEWARSGKVRPEVELDAFVLMPNHLHGVIRIRSAAAPGGAERSSARARSLSSFIAGIKSAVTSRVRKLQLGTGDPVWQRGFYEHVIRNEHELFLIRRYIRANPIMWRRDVEHRAAP